MLIFRQALVFLLVSSIGGSSCSSIAAEAEPVARTYNSIKEIFMAVPRELRPHVKPQKENPLNDPNEWLSQNIEGSRLVLKNCQVVKVHPNHRAIIVHAPRFKVGISPDYKVRHRLGPGVYCDFKKYDLKKKQLVSDDWDTVVPMLRDIRIAETHPAVSLKPKRTDGEIKKRGSLVTIAGTISQVAAVYRGTADFVRVIVSLRETKIHTR